MLPSASWKDISERLGVVVSTHGIDLSEGSLDIGGGKRWMWGCSPPPPFRTCTVYIV